MDKAVLIDAIATYGPELQKTVAIEEMSELTKEIVKDLRGNLSTLHMAEEIADVEIMIEQLKIMYNNDKLVEVYKQRKLERLKDRIDQVYNK